MMKWAKPGQRVKLDNGFSEYKGDKKWNDFARGATGKIEMTIGLIDAQGDSLIRIKFDDGRRIILDTLMVTLIK